MRYLPNTPKTRKEMLKSIDVNHIDDLYNDVPSHTLLKEPLNLPNHQSELTVETFFKKQARTNISANDNPFFLGAGYYHHHIPASVDYLIQRGEFLTSYTPYQPEVSQGTLAAIFQYQSYICSLTGQDIANASMYDGATSTAEAALMASRITKRKDVHLASHLHPHYKEVLENYLSHSGGKIAETAADENTACIIVQSPNFRGEVVDITPYRQECNKTGALLIVVITEIVSLGLLPAPKEADIVVGEAQSIGNPLSFGGPSLGFFACKEKYLRQMPGRICGQTTDKDGEIGYVLTLNTREQHIRREKATSNICTNEGLCALAFTIHLSLLGEVGFKKLARINHHKAIQLKKKLAKVGLKVLNKTFFNEFVIEVKNAKNCVEELAKKSIIAGYPIDEHGLLVTATECTSEEDMDALVSALTEAVK